MEPCRNTTQEPNGRQAVFLMSTPDPLGRCVFPTWRDIYFMHEGVCISCMDWCVFQARIGIYFMQRLVYISCRGRCLFLTWMGVNFLHTSVWISYIDGCIFTARMGVYFMQDVFPVEMSMFFMHEWVCISCRDGVYFTQVGIPGRDHSLHRGVSMYHSNHTTALIAPFCCHPLWLWE